MTTDEGGLYELIAERDALRRQLEIAEYQRDNARDELFGLIEWSNSIADRMPEDYDGDEVQESLINCWLDDVLAERDTLRARVAELESRREPLTPDRVRATIETQEAVYEFELERIFNRTLFSIDVETDAVERVDEFGLPVGPFRTYVPGVREARVELDGLVIRGERRLVARDGGGTDDR